MSKVPFSATILTLFPEMFPGPLACSLAGKALEKGIWNLKAMQIRDFTTDKHQTVDDTPYGGGAGMVMRADVLDAAIQEARNQEPGARLIYFTPRGTPLTQQLVYELAIPHSLPHRGRVRVGADASEKEDRFFPVPPALLPASLLQGEERHASLILLCGRYEGVDERLLEHHKPLEISIGDYVLSGGEMAALVLLDACVRLLPGVVGDKASLAQESFALTTDFTGLLEYPHYTKPPIWNGRKVPDVLLSGNHAVIKDWRLSEAEQTTKARRPDLWDKRRKAKN
jgi:tRNA (guanine37-N1)-methyltransferase